MIDGIVGTLAARGEAEIAVQQVSELMQADGVDIVGRLPDELQSVTVFSAGVFTASTQPELAERVRRRPRLAEACRADPPQGHGAGLASCSLHPVSAGRRPATSCFCVSLLWLAGNGLRITILAVPPVIPLIRTELGMSETQVGILTGLPPVLFACTAVLGSLLIARFGALTTLIAGLLATAAGSALRGAAPEIWTLYAATIVTGFGVAIMHPVAAAAGARLAPAPHRLRHRGVHQRAAGRRDPARGADDSGGAAVARQQLARKLPAVGRAGRRDRARFSCCSRRARPRRRRRRRSAGGRTGATR